MKKKQLFYAIVILALCFACKKNMNEVPNPECNTNTPETHYIRTKAYSADDPNANNNYYTYQYDNQNRITKLTQFDQGIHFYSFSVIYTKDTIKKIHDMIYDTAIQYYFPDCNGRITRALINNDTVLYSYNDKGYLEKRTTKDASYIFEYIDGNVSKITHITTIPSNQIPPILYTYTSYIDKAHVMDPLQTGLLQESFGKKNKNLIHSCTLGNQTVTYTYTFDCNGLPIKIKGTRNNGDSDSYQVNEFESR